MDVVFVAIVVAFWLALVAMAVGCARLEPGRPPEPGSPAASAALRLTGDGSSVEGRAS